MSEKREKAQPSFCIHDSIHLLRCKIIEYPKQEAALSAARSTQIMQTSRALSDIVREEEI